MRALLDIRWRGKLAGFVVGSVILGWAYFDQPGFSHAACEYGKEQMKVVTEHLPTTTTTMNFPGAKGRAQLPTPRDVCIR